MALVAFFGLVPNSLALGPSSPIRASTKSSQNVRWHDLTGALELQGGEKHFDIANARERFDAYVPGRAALVSQRHKAKVQDSSAANAEGLRKPAAASGPGAVSSPKVDNTPKEPENLFLNEDL